MADTRVAIQTKIIETVMSGTFPIVNYDDDTHLPIEPTENDIPKAVICNETNAGLSASKAYSAMSTKFVLRDWRFECITEFNKEVSLSSFAEELSPIKFTTEGGLIAEITFGDMQFEHPVRQGAHSGTKVIFGLTVQTRR